MKSFKMVFNNSGSVHPQFNHLGGGISRNAVQPAPRSVSLNSPMIDRVYKAKPGCSACGKKVA